MASTTIKVARAPATDDPYDAQGVAADVATGVPAHISAPSGTGSVAGSRAEQTRYPLGCDPVDLRHTDEVTDESTGTVYRVVWAEPRNIPGMEHVVAELTKA